MIPSTVRPTFRSVFALAMVFSIAALAPGDKQAGTPAAELLSRPTTRPNTIRPGDVLCFRVIGLTGPSRATVSYGRVAADGTAAVPLLGPVKVTGMTGPAVEKDVADRYVKAMIMTNAEIVVDRIWLEPTGGPVHGPLAVGDLVRIEVSSLNGNGGPWLVIHRVGSDGTVSLPVVGSIKVVGQTDGQAAVAIAKKYLDDQVIQNALVTVVTAESAPPDAEHLDLPDGPIDPVPESLRPLFAR